MLNKNDILRLTDGGLRVFRHYLNIDFRIGKNFLNPFYKDSKASCNVFFDRHNQLYRMKDFGDDSYSGDCFVLVGKLRGLDCKNASDFIQILSIINCDLNLSLNDEDQNNALPFKSITRPERNKPEPPLIQLKVKPYKITRKHFSPKELNFWQQSGITIEVLKQYRVVSLKEFISENSDNKPFSFKDDRLIIVHSDGKSKHENDIYTFLSEEVDVFNSDYLRLSCIKDNLKTSIDGEKYINLSNMLKRYYSDEITFIGPITGKQFVNIEIYRDTCNSCKKEIAVVSGIVFPKIQMPLWNNTFWQYYNTLISIYSLPSEYSKQIKREVNKLREKNTNITPLVFYQDIEAEENDWTVMCPHCRNVINKLEPEDKRMDYLFDFSSRINGNLHYYSILIDASQELINLLSEGGEYNPHVCYGGWVESKKVQL